MLEIVECFPDKKEEGMSVVCPKCKFNNMLAFAAIVIKNLKESCVLWTAPVILPIFWL